MEAESVQPAGEGGALFVKDEGNAELLVYDEADQSLQSSQMAGMVEEGCFTAERFQVQEEERMSRGHDEKEYSYRLDEDPSLIHHQYQGDREQDEEIGMVVVQQGLDSGYEHLGAGAEDDRLESVSGITECGDELCSFGVDGMRGDQVIVPSPLQTSLCQMTGSFDAESSLLPVDFHPESMHVQQPAHAIASDSPTRSSRPASPSHKVEAKRKKQVQIHLDAKAHQHLMTLVSEQHDGSVERFVNTTVTASMEDRSHCGRKKPIRKPALIKWKRLRFDQLKGTETQELALAYRFLAGSAPGAELSTSLLETSWEDLTMAQMEQMLEETKQMLLLTDKQHICPEEGCDRRFPTPGMLRDHMNEHSGDRPYVCTVEGCSSNFSSRQLLFRHLKKHECAYMCLVEGCNKRFAFRERLVVHQRTHESERPLACPYEGCEKTFKWLNSLNGHLRTHTGEKPYKCSYPDCGRDFGYKVDLTRHERTHYGQPARLHR